MILLLPFLISQALASYSPSASIFDENGDPFSSSNPLQIETIVGGSAIDPRQIRALSSGTDSCTVTGTVTANIGTIAGVATESTLSSIDGKTPALVSGRVPVDGSGVTQPVSGSLGRTWTLSSGSDSVSAVGPLTDAELRATAVPISGTVSATQGTSPWVTSRNWTLASGSDSVTAVGPLTDSQLRATPVGTDLSQYGGVAVGASNGFYVRPGTGAVFAISATSLPLPTGAATEATLLSIDTKTPALVSGRVPVDGSGVTQPVSGSLGRTWTLSGATDSLNLSHYGGSAVGAANAVHVQPGTGAVFSVSSTTLALDSTLATTNTRIGDLTETAPGTDTASSGLNGRLQRIAQRLTSLIAVFNPLSTSPAQNASGLVVRPLPLEAATFSAISENTAIANAKSMISLENAAGSAVIIRVLKIHVINTQTSALAGVLAEFQARRFTSHTGGTALTVYPMDSSDALNGSVTARTNATITGDTGVQNYGRRYWSSDEYAPGGEDVESSEHLNQNIFPTWNFMDSRSKNVILRAGEGLHIRQNTNSVNGTFDLEIVFTQEPA